MIMPYAASKCIDQPVDVHIDESDNCHCFYTLEIIGILMVMYFILFQNHNKDIFLNYVMCLHYSPNMEAKECMAMLSVTPTIPLWGENSG